MAYTSSGITCDVCGEYILLEDVFELSVNVIDRGLQAHEKCYNQVQKLYEAGDIPGGLPDGPLKKALSSQEGGK